jgi:hypothetical protein
MVGREKALKRAAEIPSVDLVKDILYRDYTPGIEDDVLIERLRKIDDKSSQEEALEQILQNQANMMVELSWIVAMLDPKSWIGRGILTLLQSQKE